MFSCVFIKFDATTRQSRQPFCYFKSQVLTSNSQDFKEGFVDWLKSQSDIGILQVIDARENSTGDCKNPTQEIELDRDNEAGSTILMPGQTLQGTRFKLPELRNLVEKYGMRLLDSFNRYTTDFFFN